MGGHLMQHDGGLFALQYSGQFRVKRIVRLNACLKKCARILIRLRVCAFDFGWARKVGSVRREQTDVVNENASHARFGLVAKNNGIGGSGRRFVIPFCCVHRKPVQYCTF